MNAYFLFYYRVEMDWATFMCGRLVMVVKMMTVIVMDTRHQCGPFRSIAQSTMAKMRIMMRAVVQH